jgi:hypothetical protein
VKAAYEFIGSLPFLSVEEKQLYIRVPWISPEDLDKWIADLKDTIKQWEDEIDDKATKWGALVNDPLKTADSKVIINARRTLASLQENLRVLEEYKRFPEKLQKYIGWKERYMEQILCNIDAIAFFLGSWLKENGKRFKAWVELYILIKAILKSWQLIIDLFLEYKASCTPCSNERYDLKHFILKLISAIIPKIPIIIFPKWPDIILDLHDIRAGLRILMPVFNFRFVPLVLPQLPRLYLPDVPTLTITLPKIPVIP